MSYIQLRITPAEVLDVSKCSTFDLKLFVSGLKEIVLASDGDYVCCYEKLNKFGEPTKPHFHATFEYADAILKNTLAKRIKNIFIKWGLPKFKGNKQYSLQIVSEPKDYSRWFRYGLKEKAIPDLTKYNGDLKTLTLLAKDERIRSQQFNVEKREKQLQKSTMYSRLEEFLDTKNLKKGTTRKVTFCYVCEYYGREEKAHNPNTMRGYADLYMLKKKWITASQYYDMNFS